MRRPGVTPFGQDQARWVVQPLVDAGLPADEVGDLVFRFAFEAVVGGVADVHRVVADRPAAVRAAWQQTLGRLVVAAAAG